MIEKLKNITWPVLLRWPALVAFFVTLIAVNLFYTFQIYARYLPDINESNVVFSVKAELFWLMAKSFMSTALQYAAIISVAVGFGMAFFKGVKGLVTWHSIMFNGVIVLMVSIVTMDFTLDVKTNVKMRALIYDITMKKPNESLTRSDPSKFEKVDDYRIYPSELKLQEEKLLRDIENIKKSFKNYILHTLDNASIDQLLKENTQLEKYGITRTYIGNSDFSFEEETGRQTRKSNSPAVILSKYEELKNQSFRLAKRRLEVTNKHLGSAQHRLRQVQIEWNRFYMWMFFPLLIYLLGISITKLTYHKHWIVPVSTCFISMMVFGALISSCEALAKGGYFTPFKGVWIPIFVMVIVIISFSAITWRKRKSSPKAEAAL